jgi:hypothetical protein
MRCKRFRWVGALALALFALAMTPTFARYANAEDGAKEGDSAKPADAAKEATKEEGVATGDLAPAWKGKTFLNSDELTLAGLRGKFVFIEYFGTG